MTAQQYCNLLCLQYKTVVSVERIDVCLEVTGKEHLEDWVSMYIDVYIHTPHPPL
jgi:hypothetical protein